MYHAHMESTSIFFHKKPYHTPKCRIIFHETMRESTGTVSNTPMKVNVQCIICLSRVTNATTFSV